MGEQVFVVSAPGKIILHGEHAVVYGKKAVAASLNLKTTVTVSVDNSSCAKLNLPVSNEVRQWNVSELGRLKTAIHGNPLKPDPLSSQDHDLIQQFLAPVNKESPSISDRISLAFVFLWKSILNNFDKGMNVKLDSQLPLAAGLGSSASVAVCLSTALLKVAGIIDMPKDGCTLLPSDLELINLWAFMVEKIFHGNPSGVDNCTCTYGGAVVYTSGCFNQKPVNLPVRILVINSMVPRNTKEMVANVRHKMEKYPTIMSPILEAMGQVADVFEQTFWRDPQPEDSEELYGTFEDLIDINQALLGAIGVSHPKLQEIIGIVNQYGFRAKLTGAGGGGVVFVLLRPGTKVDLLGTVKEKLALRGFQHWDVTVGGPGVQIVNATGDI